MASEQNQRTSSDIKYQFRFIKDNEWLTIDEKQWLAYLCLDFFDHEQVAFALESNIGKTKTSKTKAYRAIKCK